jgi:hypothetical membrane protein
MKIVRRQDSLVLWTGLFGGPLFLASLLLFGALTPGFSQLHKSVSALGGIGTPWGPWFNGFGLLLPGLFATGVAVEFRRRLRAAKINTRWATGLVVFGAMLALTAIPADFSLMFRSPLTWVHAFFALGDLLVFFLVVPGCAKTLKAFGASPISVRIFVVLGYLPSVEFFLYGIFPHVPGLVQRLMIFTVHCVMASLSWTLLQIGKNNRPVEKPGAELKTSGLDF